MRVLVVEDDPATADYIGKSLSAHNWNVTTSADGKEALFLSLESDFDVIIVDRMVPGIDGLSLVKSLRAAGCNTPALFLSALGEVSDRVAGLKAGGDDYLAKPFAISELLARVDALTRRPAPYAQPSVLRVGDLELDVVKRTVERKNQNIDVKPREFLLLEFLMRNAGKVVTRSMLLEGVWDYHFDPQTNIIEVHISRLRQKIDKCFDEPLLHTVRGAGYSLHA